MCIYNKEDTIAAISTVLGESAIGIVRMSGKKSIKIINKIYKYKKKKIINVKSHTINYGYIINPKNKEIIDEVLVSIMKAPKTFTKEDIVEINCHGGFFVINKILKILLDNGARLAEPGEFTKRAFLNGRIDLSQAEAVIELIKAKTEKSINIILNQLTGKLYKNIKKIHDEILNISTKIEADIENVEEEIIIEKNEILKKIINIKKKIKILLSNSDKGKIICNGLNIAIIGKPNVGKSSLFNKLIEKEKSIVTNIKGTTRDFIEESINILGIPINFIDTAGIHKTNNLIEKKGIEKTFEILKKADLVLIIFDNSEKIEKEDLYLLNLIKNKKKIILLNKIDLENKLNIKKIKIKNKKEKIIKISLFLNIGINKLKNTIFELFFYKEKNKLNGNIFLSNIRHIKLIEKVYKNLNNIINSIRKNIPIDLIQIDLIDCIKFLNKIMGKNIENEVIKEIFKKFCLGK